NTQFVETYPTTQKLAAAIDAGWTSASPTTATTMAASFSAEFAGYLFPGIGQTFIYCIASGIDAEIAAWVASWDTLAQIHTYPPNAASIISRIMACSPVQSAGAQAIAEAVADAFMAGFGQEVG
ncbi:MAG: hypothetical protein OQK82_01590, partial [Candidatus Pacearchaeota archaeon]|nr:hypothetical protein [Candidatus Pacearchaeota archaeon]